MKAVFIYICLCLYNKIDYLVMSDYCYSYGFPLIKWAGIRKKHGGHTLILCDWLCISPKIIIVNLGWNLFQVNGKNYVYKGLLMFWIFLLQCDFCSKEQCKSCQNVKTSILTWRCVSISVLALCPMVSKIHLYTFEFQQ